jgi:two-component system nitrogen regulation sensor histidine kinase GlnL
VRRAPSADHILQGLSTALLVLDEAMHVAYLNPAAESLFGISLRRTIGRTLSEVVHPAQELVVLCQRALATGLSFSLHEFATRVGDRDMVLDCRVALLDHEHSLILEFRS